MNKSLKMLVPFVDALAETFGSNCEVVLHDLSKPEHSIIKIANNHLTGREVGSPVTDFVLTLINKGDSKKDYFVGYPTKSKKGVELKSTTIFIRDIKGKIVGALCINFDITPFLSAKNMLDQMCRMSFQRDCETGNGPSEKFVTSTETLINELLDQTIKRNGKLVALMDKQDKLRIIEDLKEKGIFLIKGSAKKVSRELNVSLPTIYKYLEEIRKPL